jgi:hypothetical protein
MTATDRAVRYSMVREKESGESCMKPIDMLTRAIETTSPGDFALFLIALNRRDRDEAAALDSAQL